MRSKAVILEEIRKAKEALGLINPDEDFMTIDNRRVQINIARMHDTIVTKSFAEVVRPQVEIVSLDHKGNKKAPSEDEAKIRKAFERFLETK